MASSFVVGGRYRNRQGAYRVLSIQGDRMTIRYDSGQEAQVSVETQMRIRANMEAERDARPAAAAERVRSKGHRASGRKPTHFEGLCEQDFQRGVAGTSWRRRSSLGGLLAEELSLAAGAVFQSYAIYRRAEVHIARPEHYDKSDRRGWRAAKFLFRLDPEQAFYGFYIEKNNGPMDSTWLWPNLMAALRDDASVQQAVLEAMRRLGLHWEAWDGEKYHLLARVTAGAEGLTWQPDEGNALALGWPEFVRRLLQVSEQCWCDLYLCTRMPKAQALAEQAGVVKAAVEVYRALLSLYEAAVGEG